MFGLLLLKDKHTTVLLAYNGDLNFTLRSLVNVDALHGKNYVEFYAIESKQKKIIIYSTVLVANLIQSCKILMIPDNNDPKSTTVAIYYA